MIYDISQPLLECEVYPGDPRPVKTALCRMEDGDLYNLTALSLCVHNGTHIDAPYHFYRDGKGVGSIDLARCIGPAFVTAHDGPVTAADAAGILEKARQHGEAWKKLLFKGDAVVTAEAAEAFAAAGVDLIGSESQTVGPEDAPMAVHLILLKAEVVLLEGIRLEKVPEGVYLLNAAPLCLTDTDGAPCRAVLLTL